MPRLQSLSVPLKHQLQVLELEDKIQSPVQQDVDKSQREYYLREHMRVIQDELGEFDSHMSEVKVLRERMAQAHMPEEAQAMAHAV
ncbi:MAG: hypothetical protein H8E35_01745 [Ardenticatenia bacterium]|nr:hypothetical protein [Ardenticatenia bacterium]